MKIVYTNKAMNKRKNSHPSLKALLLMGFLVLSMVAVKVIYNPTDTMEEIAAMAYSEETEESEEIQY